MWGGFFTIFAFSEAVVSPVLKPTSIFWRFIPFDFASSFISSRGSIRFLCISLLRAFKGET